MPEYIAGVKVPRTDYMWIWGIDYQEDKVKISDINGQLISLLTTGIAIVIAVLTSFHIVSLTTDESNAVTPLAIAGVGVGLYCYSLIHSWATASYDLARVTTLLTAAASAAMALLTAFGVFKFDASQQASILGLASGLAFVGGIVFSYLHTGHQLMLLRAQIALQGVERRP